MKTEATMEQREFCKNFLLENSIAQRGQFDGNYFKQLFGLIGQIIITDMFELERPKNEGFDGGVDLKIKNKTFDVKCVIRKVDPKGHFANNLTASQIKYNVEAYIFLSYNQNTGQYSICGWIPKKEFLKKARFFKKGENRPRDDGTFMKTEASNYEILNKDLKRFSVLKIRRFSEK